MFGPLPGVLNLGTSGCLRDHLSCSLTLSFPPHGHLHKGGETDISGTIFIYPISCSSLYIQVRYLFGFFFFNSTIIKMTLCK